MYTEFWCTAAVPTLAPGKENPSASYKYPRLSVQTMMRESDGREDSGIAGQKKTDVVIACGTNPKHPISGDECKALASCAGRPIVYPVARAWAGLEGIGCIYLAGPRARLEKELAPLLDKGGIENYVLVNEPRPGDAEAMIGNIEEVCSRYTLSRYSYMSTCDILGFDSRKAATICHDIGNEMQKDYLKSSFAELYFTAGYQEEDMDHFKTLKDWERPGIPFSSREVLRFGSVHLFDTEESLKGAGRIKELLSYRKLKYQWLELIQYAWRVLGDDAPWYVPTVKRHATLKALANSIRRFGITLDERAVNKRMEKLGLKLKATNGKIHLPLERLVGSPVIPYFQIPLEVVEKAAHDITGVRVRIVKTRFTTPDIDSLEELSAAEVHLNNG
jgi:hypothetical protein